MSAALEANDLNRIWFWCDCVYNMDKYDFSIRIFWNIHKVSVSLNVSFSLNFYISLYSIPVTYKILSYAVFCWIRNIVLFSYNITFFTFYLNYSNFKAFLLYNNTYFKDVKKYSNTYYQIYVLQYTHNELSVYVSNNLCWPLLYSCFKYASFWLMTPHLHSNKMKFKCSRDFLVALYDRYSYSQVKTTHVISRWWPAPIKILFL